MAVLMNMSKRGFILKEGFLNPGASLKVSEESAKLFSNLYAGELKAIFEADVTEDKKEVKTPKAEKEVKAK